MGSYGLHSCDSREGPVAGSCEHVNKSSASVRGREFFD
jgi:hypothetical protein